MTELEKGTILKNLVKDEKNRHKLYADCVEHACDMAVHMYGEKPEKLLKRTRPHEDPAITAYRLESYEPTTKATAEKGLTIVNKIFHPNNYSINFESDSASTELKKYSLESYPVFNSIVSYLSEYALKKVIADANGLFVVQPYDFNVPSTVRVKPFVTVFASCDVWDITSEYVVIFIDKKEETRDKYFLFQFIDKTTITNYKLITTNSQDYVLSIVSQYVHNLNELPVWASGGVYDQNKPGLFESFFNAAVPFWNKAINAESDLDGAYVKHMNPQKWEMADECDYVLQTDHGNYACSSGYIFDSIAGSKTKCTKCGGHGYKSLTGPYDVAFVNKEKFSGENNTINVPPFGYVTVPTEATAMLEKRVDALLEKGLYALNMDVVNKIGENQSGVSKTIDRTELNDFLGKIRDRFFDTHLKNFYYFAAKYMFGFDGGKTDSIEPQIIKPSSFDIYNTTELTEQMKVSKDSGLSPAYLQTKQSEIQNKEFQQNPSLLAKLNLILTLDPLAGTSREDIISMLADGTVLKTTAIIHDNITTFINQALIESKNFINMDYIKQMEVLKGYADKVEEENKVSIEVLPLFEPEPVV